MTNTYYSVTTDSFSTFINDFILSGQDTLDLTNWSVKLGTGTLQPTHATTDLINPIYDKTTTGYVGFTASDYAQGGKLISINIPTSVLQGNIITEIGLYDSDDVLMCAAATYLDLTMTSGQGLQPSFVEQLVLKDVPSNVTIVYEAWEDYQLLSEKNQANGYCPLDENSKVPQENLYPVNLDNYQKLSQKGQANGYCPLNENAIVPIQHLPELNYANMDLSNLSATGEAHFVKPNVAVTHTANTSVGSSTNPVYVNSSGVATACGFTWSTIHAVITKYNSGTSWYRVWSDGWIEQGGLTAESTDKIHTVSFLKPFSNTYYTAMCCVCDTTAAAVKTWYDTQIVTKAKANMTIGNNNATSRKISWYACGY